MRIGIIQDWMSQLELFNNKEDGISALSLYMFFGRDRGRLRAGIEHGGYLRSHGIECKFSKSRSWLFLK